MATTEAGSDRICIGAFKRRGFGLAKGHFGQTCLHVQSYVVFRVPASSTGHGTTARTIVELSFPPRDSEVEQGAFSPSHVERSLLEVVDGNVGDSPDVDKIPSRRQTLLQRARSTQRAQATNTRPP